MKTKQILIIAIIILTIFVTQKVLATTNFVGTSGTPSGNYFTNIQSAVDASFAGDLVLVSNGVYATGETVTPGFTSSNRVVITENLTVRSVSGPATTIILGAQAPGGGTGDGAVRCVFMTSGLLDGFTLSNGFTLTSGDWTYDQAGGGVWLTNGCVITNCVISGNSATDDGGGAYCYMGGQLSTCTISDNTAGWGGGVTCQQGGQLYACTISGNIANVDGGGVDCYDGGILSECTISGNSAKDDGGGAYCNSGGQLFACTFIGNTADWGGGVTCLYGGQLSDCTIIGNSANENGGGVDCYDGGSLSDCIISNNTTTGKGGGAFCVSGGQLSDCKISDNSAGELGGGVYFRYSGAMTNCLIYNSNSAAFGGGVYCRDGGGDLFNCTIAGNYASDNGGGIVCSNGGYIANTIIYDNTVLSGSNNWKNYNSGAAFSFCCTAPTNGLPGGIGCISDNPMFNAPGSDYHLQGFSPCVNSGTNMPWMAPPATDLDGNPRIYNGTVDMGCYEFVPEPLGIWIIGLLELWIIGSRRKLNY